MTARPSVDTILPLTSDCLTLDDYDFFNGCRNARPCGTAHRNTRQERKPRLCNKLKAIADSGIPIDLLLRIAVQSIGGLSDAAMLGGPTVPAN
jgi:hypothetical protein